MEHYAIGSKSILHHNEIGTKSTKSRDCLESVAGKKGWGLVKDLLSTRPFVLKEVQAG